MTSRNWRNMFMKKSLAIMLTSSLLFTAMIPTIVKAGPTGKSKSTDRDESDRRARSEKTDKDRRARFEDRDKDRDREAPDADSYGADLTTPKDQYKRVKDTEDRSDRGPREIDPLAPRNGLEDREKQDDKEPRAGVDQSDRTAELDRLVNKMTNVSFTPENEAYKSVSNIKASFEKMPEIFKAVTNSGTKIQLIDYPVSTVDGYKRNEYEEALGDITLDMDKPYYYSRERDTLYLRLEAKNASRTTPSQNYALEGLAEVFFEKYAANVLRDENIGKNIKAERASFTGVDPYLKEELREKIDGDKYAFSKTSIFSRSPKKIIVKSAVQTENDKKYTFEGSDKREIIQDAHNNKHYAANSRLYNIKMDSAGNKFITMSGKKTIIRTEPSTNTKYLVNEGNRVIIGSAPSGASVKSPYESLSYFEINKEKYYINNFNHILEFGPSSNQIIEKRLEPIKVISQNGQEFVERSYDIETTSDGQKFVKIDGRNYGIEKEGHASYLRDLDKSGFVQHYFINAPKVGYLSKAFVSYMNDPVGLKQNFPKTFDIIDKVVKSNVTPGNITESEIKQAIDANVSVHFVANKEQLQPWEQEMINEYNKQIKKLGPNVLKRLDKAGVWIEYISRPVYDHPVFNDEAYKHERDSMGLAAGIMGLTTQTQKSIIFRIIPREVRETIDIKVTPLHELFHAIANEFYDTGTRPDMRSELETIMEKDKRKGPNRLFGENDHFYRDPQEFFAQSMAYRVMGDTVAPGENQSYEQILKKNCPEMFDYTEKVLKEISFFNAAK